jgi:hypothetical protein
MMNLFQKERDIYDDESFSERERYIQGDRNKRHQEIGEVFYGTQYGM